jgi:hypothetical protein
MVGAHNSVKFGEVIFTMETKEKELIKYEEGYYRGLWAGIGIGLLLAFCFFLATLL